jgi:hypothetical protein
VEKMVRWGKILKRYGGSVSVIGPKGVRRPSYDFSANKANIVTALNEIGKALADIGGMPMSALETAQISKAYLQKIGYRFQS